MSLTKSEINMRYRKKHPDRDKASKDSWVAKNPDYNKEYQKEYRKKNPNAVNEWRKDNRMSAREAHLKNKFGITHFEFEFLKEFQGGVCAICKTPTDKTLHVDHDHATSKVRGLLCSNCNRGIGHLKENVVFLAEAIKYLENNKDFN